MKKPSAKSVQGFIQRQFSSEDARGPFIPREETAGLSRQLLSTYKNIYCGVLPDEVLGMKFVVRSAKTNHYFAVVRVK